MLGVGMDRFTDDAGDLFDDDLPDDQPPDPPISDDDSGHVFDLDEVEICYTGDPGLEPYPKYDDDSNPDEDSLRFRTPHEYLDLVRGEWYSDVPPEPFVYMFD